MDMLQAAGITIGLTWATAALAAGAWRLGIPVGNAQIAGWTASEFVRKWPLLVGVLPLCEEVVFRAYPAWQWGPSWICGIATALVFAGAHSVVVRRAPHRIELSRRR